MTNAKKILVTGGAGFIGSAVIRHLIHDTEHSVVNVDKLTYAGNLESLESVSENERYAFEQVDICDAVNLQRVFIEHEPDIVMHLAAESHVDRSIDGPGEFIQTNIVGTYTLLEQARAYWTSLPAGKKENFRFHHISTDEVYGDLPHPDEILNQVQDDESSQSESNIDCHSGLDNETKSNIVIPDLIQLVIPDLIRNLYLCLPKKPLMHQVRHILHPKPVRIT